MTNILKYAGFAVAGIVVGLLLSASGATFGGVYNQVIEEFRAGLKAGTSNQLVIDSDGDISSTGTLTLGSDGSAVDVMLFGSCTLVNYAGSFTATTSLNHNCSATGVVSGDKVFVSMPINGPLGVINVSNSIFLVGAAASSTSNNITVTLFNNTGTATTSYAQATTSVLWWALR